MWLDIYLSYQFQGLPAGCVCVRAACGASATSKKHAPGFWNLDFVTVQRFFILIDPLPLPIKVKGLYIFSCCSHPQIKKNRPLVLWLWYHGHGHAYLRTMAIWPCLRTMGIWPCQWTMPMDHGHIYDHAHAYGPWPYGHAHMEPIWAHMGPIWAHMDPYGPIWISYGTHRGPIWTHQDSIWVPYGTHMRPYGASTRYLIGKRWLQRETLDKT